MITYLHVWPEESVFALHWQYCQLRLDGFRSYSFNPQSWIMQITTTIVVRTTTSRNKCHTNHTTKFLPWGYLVLCLQDIQKSFSLVQGRKRWIDSKSDRFVTAITNALHEAQRHNEKRTMNWFKTIHKPSEKTNNCTEAEDSWSFCKKWWFRER